MPKYLIRVSDGKTIEQPIDAKDDDDAFSIAVTALSHFACSKFPPPESAEVVVMDTERVELATMRFRFEIDLKQTERKFN